MINRFSEYRWLRGYVWIVAVLGILQVVPLQLVLAAPAVNQELIGSDIELPGGSGTVAPASEQSSLHWTDLILHASPTVKLVMLMLVLMSCLTWAIVFAKGLRFNKAKRESEQFSNIFWGSRNLAQINEASQALKASPVAAVYAAGHRELTHIIRGNEGRAEGAESGDMDNILRALQRAKAEEITRLEAGTTFLATTASAAPFIGLFGTVWGIMNAFIGLSHVKNTSIQAVAPGISEALIATAIGLFAAIPAAIAYNYFMQQVRVFSRNMDMFSAEFLNIARRHFLK